MDKLLPIIIQLIGGGAGGNAVAALLKNLNLDKIIATITGIIGGVAGGQAASALGILQKIIEAIGGTGGEVVANGGASAIGGALLTAIVGLIKKAMAGVNTAGTGARAFAGAQYTSGGKTGTAQVIAIKANEKYIEKNVAERHRDHSLFIAFAPLENPKIALAVIVENGGFGARAAAPIARAVLDYYLLGKTPPEPKQVPVNDSVKEGDSD